MNASETPLPKPSIKLASLTEEWQNFAKAVWPHGMTSRQEVQLRMTFFAAFVLMLRKVSDISVLVPDKDLAALEIERLRREAMAYCKDITYLTERQV